MIPAKFTVSMHSLQINLERWLSLCKPTDTDTVSTVVPPCAQHVARVAAGSCEILLELRLAR